jgi:hypothetical protein
MSTGGYPGMTGGEFRGHHTELPGPWGFLWVPFIDPRLVCQTPCRICR